MEKEQLAWLEKDLAAVDRKTTPWIMVMSHFPLYHTSIEANLDSSADWYTSARAEFADSAQGEFRPCEGGNSCRTVREHVGAIQSALDPLFEKYGVDFYNAGHVHDCERAS